MSLYLIKFSLLKVKSESDAQTPLCGKTQRDAREVSADAAQTHPRIRNIWMCCSLLPDFARRRAIWRNPPPLHHHTKVKAREDSTLSGRRFKKKKQEKEKEKLTPWQKMPACSFGSTLHNPAGTSFGTSCHWFKHTAGPLACVSPFDLCNKSAKKHFREFMAGERTKRRTLCFVQALIMKFLNIHKIHSNVEPSCHPHP